MAQILGKLVLPHIKGSKMKKKKIILPPIMALSKKCFHKNLVFKHK
jgi:hypothetical protein